LRVKKGVPVLTCARCGRAQNFLFERRCRHCGQAMDSAFKFCPFCGEAAN
jgi:hypothetical protein